MKQLLTIIFLAAMAWTAQAQTSAVTVNSAGKIVVPANGTLTSNGTLTAGNITTAGVLNLSTGNATAAASGNATGLTSGTLPDSRLSSSVARRDEDNTMLGDLYLNKPTSAGILRYVPGLLQVYATDGVQIGTNSFASAINILPSRVDIFGPYIHLQSPVYIGTNSVGIKAIRSTTAAFDLPDTAAQTSASNVTVTLANVTTADTPSVTLTFSDPSQVAGWQIAAAVTSADTITIYSKNLNSGNSNPGSVTCRVMVTTF